MIKIICVGKLKEEYLVNSVNDYLNRIGKYHKISLIEVKDSNINDEKNEIQKHIKKEDYVIAMVINSKEYSSVEFASKLEGLFTNGRSNITFIIGGSDGIDNSIIESCDEKISFSKLTFPHGLFRTMLLEQIYRAFKIINNETYHK